MNKFKRPPTLRVGGLLLNPNYKIHCGEFFTPRRFFNSPIITSCLNFNSCLIKLGADITKVLVEGVYFTCDSVNLILATSPITRKLSISTDFCGACKVVRYLANKSRTATISPLLLFILTIHRHYQIAYGIIRHTIDHQRPANACKMQNNTIISNMRQGLN
jgi:hypothetical protein